MTSSKDLNIARKTLLASLGENSKLYVKIILILLVVNLTILMTILILLFFIANRYLEKMKLWFQMKVSII